MMETPENTDQQQPKEVEPYDARKANRRTFISSFALLASGAFAYWGWDKLYHAPKETAADATAGARAPLRKVLDMNGDIAERAVSPDHLSKTYPKAMAAKKPRVNGKIGLNNKAVEDWTLTVYKTATENFKLTLDDLKKLPKSEFAFEFKCVEGWSQISHWGGVRFSDFIKHYNLTEQAAMAYVGLNTRDEKYYVGIDMPSALHPQTLLCYEVSGQPLPLEHGAPLRLIIPTKYGIKNLKQVGNIFFSNERPPDYWAELGYDYFSGL